MMELKSLPLQKLNLLSQNRRFALEDLNFVESPQAQHWAPPQMTPLSYLKSFQKLTRPQQMRYNQLFALGVAEQFIWFEGELIGNILPQVAKKTEDKDLQRAILYFLEDEEKHSEMFWQLLEKQEPKLYPNRKFAFLNLGKAQKFLVNFMIRRPQWNLVWIWMAIFFEERTMDYSQKYIETAGTDGGLNENFVQAHRLHLQDEARHFQMDLYFLKEYYDPQSKWKKWWAQFMMKRLMKAYTSPRRISFKILERLMIEYPDLTIATVESLKQELLQIRHNQDFIQSAFGEKAVPRSRELMRRYPEMRAILELLS